MSEWRRECVVGLALALLAAGGLAAQEASPAPGAPVAAAAEAAPAARPAPTAVVETGLGSFTIRLLPDLAPAHVKHFLATARKGGYDGTTFHRLIAGGIIQGGDPLSRDPKKTALYGTGGLTSAPPWKLKPEFSERPMTRGSVAAVLLPGKPSSAGTQFFVCLGDQPALTGKYTIFGEVIAGIEVADKIGMAPVTGDKAVSRIEMKVSLPEPAP